MVKHTIHYQLEHLKRAGWTGFVQDFKKIMREYWHMKRALREVAKLADGYQMMSISGYDVAERCKAIVSELEKKVRL